MAVGQDVVILDADRAEVHSMDGPISLISVAPKGEYVACCSPSGRQTVHTLDLAQVRLAGPCCEVHAIACR